MKKNLSIVEVAKKAGVSHTTVSNVINSRQGVSLETVERIKHVMQDIGYRPLPRDKRRGPRLRSNENFSQFRIAILLCGTRSDVMSFIGHDMIAGIAYEAKTQQIETTLTTSSDDMAKIERKDFPFDGYIVHGDVSDSLANFLRDKPCVLLNSRGDMPWADRVRPDHDSAGRQAFQYLVEQGCESLVLVNLLPDHPAFRLRQYGFIQAAQEAVKEVQVFQLDTSNQNDVLEKYTADYISKEIAARRNHKPVGVFFVQDIAASKVYWALHQLGQKPGDWLKAIGCDNDCSALGSLEPRPATFDVRAEAIGKRAVVQLLWRIKNHSMEDPMTVLVTPRLISSAE
jgi:LacI family transcriptional regulator